MKKRNHIDRGRFFVLVGLILLAVAMTGNFFWAYKLNERMDLQIDHANRVASNDFFRMIYQDAAISSDAEWYILPESKLKLPYFASMARAPLSYRTELAGWGDEEHVSAYYLAVSHFSGVLMDDKNGGFDEYNEKECIQGYVISIGEDSEDYFTGDDFEIVRRQTLNDGRVVYIWQAQNNACAKFSESDDGKRLFESLKLIENI